MTYNLSKKPLLSHIRPYLKRRLIIFVSLMGIDVNIILYSFKSCNRIVLIPCEICVTPSSFLNLSEPFQRTLTCLISVGSQKVIVSVLVLIYDDSKLKCFHILH